MKNFKYWSLIAGGCLIAVGLMANAGRTAYVTDDPRVPSPTYQSATPVSYFNSGVPYTINSFFDVFPEYARVPPPSSPGSEVDITTPPSSFFDVFIELDRLGLP